MIHPVIHTDIGPDPRDNKLYAFSLDEPGSP